MGKVYFEPWVGNSYRSGGGIFNKKILVIGNNHYCSRNECGSCGVSGNSSGKWECSTMTEDVVQEYIDYQNGNGSYLNWMNTFSTFEKSLDDNAAAIDVWNSVAFYNYLQSAVNADEEKSSSQNIYRKYRDDYYASEDSLWEVIGDLKPDYIVVWGSVVRDHLGSQINSKTGIPVLFVHHPSQGYDIEYWKNELKNFLK